MAIPPSGSAIEKMMLAQMRDAALMEYRGSFFEQFVRPLTGKISDKIQFKIRRAPYAADTWQMLDDLGIEPARRRVRLPQEITILFSHKEIING